MIVCESYWSLSGDDSGVTISVSCIHRGQKMNQVVSNGLASAPAIKQYVKAAEACGVDIQPLLAEAYRRL